MVGRKLIAVLFATCLATSAQAKDTLDARHIEAIQQLMWYFQLTDTPPDGVWTQSQQATLDRVRARYHQEREAARLAGKQGPYSTTVTFPQPGGPPQDIDGRAFATMASRASAGNRTRLHALSDRDGIRVLGAMPFAYYSTSLERLPLDWCWSENGQQRVDVAMEIPRETDAWVDLRDGKGGYFDVGLKEHLLPLLDTQCPGALEPGPKGYRQIMVKVYFKDVALAWPSSYFVESTCPEAGDENPLQFWADVVRTAQGYDVRFEIDDDRLLRMLDNGQGRVTFEDVERLHKASATTPYCRKTDVYFHPFW